MRTHNEYIIPADKGVKWRYDTIRVQVHVPSFHRKLDIDGSTRAFLTRKRRRVVFTHVRMRTSASTRNVTTPLRATVVRATDKC